MVFHAFQLKFQEHYSKVYGNFAILKIKEIKEENNAENICKQMQNNEEELLKDPKENKKRWKEYIEDLYDKDGQPIVEQFNLDEEEQLEIDESGPELIDAEIMTAYEYSEPG